MRNEPDEPDFRIEIYEKADRFSECTVQIAHLMKKPDVSRERMERRSDSVD